MSSPLDVWPHFAALVQARLERGATDYGDRSLEKPPATLADEIAEELADVCGWSVVLYTRVQALRERLALLEQPDCCTLQLTADETSVLDGLAASMKCSREKVIRLAMLALADKFDGAERFAQVIEDLERTKP